MCFAGSIRDVILMKNFDLLSIIGALFAVMLIFNLATGNFHFELFRSADRALPASLEYSGYVCRWICSRSRLADAHCVRSFWQGRAPRTVR